MDMRKLLEAVTKFAGEPKQRAGDQVRGTDKAKKGSKEHPFKGQLVGDSKDNMLRGLSQVAEDKSLEWELAEAYSKFMEDDLGVEPKRPTRKGSRHARGHEPKSGYTTVKAEEGFAQDSADAQRSLSAAATDRVLQKYQDDPELSAIAKFMSRNNWTAQSIDDTMQGRGQFDIDWWKNTMSKNLPETKHKRKGAAVYEGIESADPVEGAVLAAVQKLIQQGHTEVAPEVITNMVVAATSQPFLLKDLVDVNNKSAAVQHYVNSINPAKVKFSNEILTVKNEDPLKDKKSAQAGVGNMAARAAGRNRLGEASTPLRDKEDYKAKNKALQDIQMDPSTSQDPELTAELARRKAELVQQAKKLGIDESRAHKIIANKLKQIELQRKISGDRESDDERNIRMAKQQKDYIKNTPDTIFKREIDEYGANQPTGTAGQTATTQSSTTGTNQAAAVQQAATAIKSATQSKPASQTTSANPADVKALEPLMKAMVQDPKLAGELKTISQKMQ